MLYITSATPAIRNAPRTPVRTPKGRDERRLDAGPHARTDGARRALNVAVALAGLILTAPLFILIALLVRATSKGPVLYVQTRVGMDRRWMNPHGGNGRRRVDFGGRPFKMYKFRTMHVNGGDRTQVWAQPDDPRVTPIGRVLRKFRLDELPQLINVLKGDMNIVGPRPEQPLIFLDLRTKIDGYQQRQRVAPGITGWAQVNQNYDTCVDDVRRKLDLDLEYIGRRSLLEDLRIMLRTLPVMLFRKGGW